MTGLGDLISYILKPFEPLKQLIFKKDCGCTKRKNFLNKLLPFKRLDR